MPSVVFPGLSVLLQFIFNPLVDTYKPALKKDLITELFFSKLYAEVRNTLTARDYVSESKEL